MGRLDDRLNEHPLTERIARLRSQVDGLSNKARKAADQQEPEGTLERLDAVLAFVEGVIAGSDPRLVSTTMLDNADAQMLQLEPALTALIDEEAVAQLPTIDGLSHDLLNHIGTWPTASVFARDEVSEVAASFGRAAESRLRRLDEGAESIRSQLATIERTTEEKTRAAGRTTG